MRLPAILLLVTTVALGSTGCVRVDLTSVRVKDPGAVGVVGDEDDRWLLAPDRPPEKVEIYKSIAGTAKLSREASGRIDYTWEHWALGTRIDTTQLLDAQGRIGWTGSMGQTRRLTDALRAGGELRLHAVNRVQQTGPFGTCNGTQLGSCTSSPAVPMSLATDGRNIEQIDVTRTSVHGFGIFEVIFGSFITGTGLLGGAVGVQVQDTATRNAVVAVSAGVITLGGLILANGLWRVLTPDRKFVYRAQE